MTEVTQINGASLSIFYTMLCMTRQGEIIEEGKHRGIRVFVNSVNDGRLFLPGHVLQ